MRMSRTLSPAYKAKRSRHKRLRQQRGSLTLEYGIVISGISLAFVMAMIGALDSADEITSALQTFMRF